MGATKRASDGHSLSGLGVAVAVCALIAGGAAPGRAQNPPPEDEWLIPRTSDAAAAEKELATLFRVLRQGSGPDRAQARLRMAALGRDAVPGLLVRAEDGGHWLSRNAALVLGELRDRRAVPTLLRNAGDAGRGDPVGSLLALGRLGDPAALTTLTVQAASARSRTARAAAALALGALGGPEATARLAEFARTARLDADTSAFLCALGMTGEPSAVEVLVPFLSSREDRVRRTGVAALAALGAPGAEAFLAGKSGDEDPFVRIAALEGLALVASEATASGPDVAGRLGAADAAERAAAAAVVGARANTTTAEAAAKRVFADASEKVRAAFLAAAFAREEPWVDLYVARGAEDRHAVVRRCAVIAYAVRAAREGGQSVAFDLRADRDADVRDVALVADAWRRGEAARPSLQAAIAARRDDRTVARAESLLAVLEQPAALAHRILRAELQVVLDDLGVAAGWNPLRRLNRAVIVALDAEDALPEEEGKGPAGPTPAPYVPGGGGVPSGAVGTGGGGRSGAQPDRPRARRRPPPELEDLRRHLDRYPYADRRPRIEIPLVR